MQTKRGKLNLLMCFHGDKNNWCKFKYERDKNKKNYANKYSSQFLIGWNLSTRVFPIEAADMPHTFMEGCQEIDLMTKWWNK